MSKHITAQELSEIVTGLLLSPDSLGELMEADQYRSFMLGIGEVVANHCGGHANGVGKPQGMKEDMLSISPNDSLPSLNSSVWSAYDPGGWSENDTRDLGLHPGEPLSQAEAAKRRSAGQNALCSKSDLPVHIAHPIIDWRAHEGMDTEEAGDERPYQFSFHSGNQPCLIFSDTNGDEILGVGVEINHGVPALHLDICGDSFLHIHADGERLVLAPGDDRKTFTRAKPDRFSGGLSNALELS